MKRVAKRRTRTRCRDSTDCRACPNTHSTNNHRHCGSRQGGWDRHRNYAKYLLCHHPLNALEVESNPASQCLNISHQVSSFLKFLHTPLYPQP